MLCAEFEGLITGSNSSGEQFICAGKRTAFVDIIAADAPKDWTMGPKMNTGEYGVFLNNACYPSGHSPYAIATAKTEADAKSAAAGCFRQIKVAGGKVRLQSPEWRAAGAGGDR